MLLELAVKRRSVRNYSGEDVSLEDVLYALEVARHAPSGGNRQPWRFLIIKDRKLREVIRRKVEDAEKKFHERAPKWMKLWFKKRKISWEKPFLTEAPILILVFGKRTEPYWVQSVWTSVGFLILALVERGLSTLTYTPSDTSWVYDLLNVPREYVLQAILPVGYPKSEEVKPPKLPISQIVYFERWESKTNRYSECIEL